MSGLLYAIPTTGAGKERHSASGKPTRGCQSMTINSSNGQEPLVAVGALCTTEIGGSYLSEVACLVLFVLLKSFTVVHNTI